MQPSNQKIGLTTAVIIGMNSIIGAGIFSTITLLGSNVGPAGILTFIIAFITIWFIAQAFARVAYLYPQEGSFYNYASQLGGHKFGLIIAGSYLLGVLMAMGLLCKFLSFAFLSNIFPSVSPTLIGMIIIASLTALNMAGAVLSKIGQYILITLTIYPLVAITGLCLTNFNLANLTPFAPYGFVSILAATKVASFGFFGFESIASMFNVMQHPEKSVPQALRISILMVGIIYLVFLGSIILGIPQQAFTDHSNFIQILFATFPEHRLIVQSISISIIFSIMGTVHAMIWSASELLLSYVKFIRINAVQKLIASNTITQKTTAVICGFILAVSFISIQNTDVFFSIVNVCLLFAFIASISSLLFIKKEWQSGQNYITLLGIICAFIIFGVAVQTLLHHLLS